MQGHGKWPIFQDGLLPASVNQIENFKKEKSPLSPSQAGKPITSLVRPPAAASAQQRPPPATTSRPPPAAASRRAGSAARSSARRPPPRYAHRYIPARLLPTAVSIRAGSTIAQQHADVVGGRRVPSRRKREDGGAALAEESEGQRVACRAEGEGKLRNVCGEP